MWFLVGARDREREQTKLADFWGLACIISGARFRRTADISHSKKGISSFKNNLFSVYMSIIISLLLNSCRKKEKNFNSLYFRIAIYGFQYIIFLYSFQRVT